MRGFSAQLLKKTASTRRAAGNGRQSRQIVFETEGESALCEYNRSRTLPISSITTMRAFAVYPKAEKAKNLSRNLRCKRSLIQ